MTKTVNKPRASTDQRLLAALIMLGVNGVDAERLVAKYAAKGTIKALRHGVIVSTNRKGVR